MVADNSSELKTLDMRIICASDNQLILIYSTLPFFVPKENMLKVGHLLARANYCLTCANFELDWESGQVRLKASIDYGAAMDVRDIVKSMVKRSVTVFNAYVESVYYVSLGGDPQDHFRSIQQAVQAQHAARTAQQVDVDDMDYEQLSELCELLGDVKPKGLSQASISQLPTTTYVPKKPKKTRKAAKAATPREGMDANDTSDVKRNNTAVKTTPPNPFSSSSTTILPHNQAKVCPGQNLSHVFKKNQNFSPNSTTTTKSNNLTPEAKSSTSPIPSPGSESEVEVLSCCICLCDIEAGQAIKTLPCFHSFHAEELDKWLREKAKCPVCNVPVVL